MDDRKAKILRDEIEREQRTARAIVAANRAATQALSSPGPRSPSPQNLMPGSGHILGLPSAEQDEPPAYEDHPHSD